MAMLTAVPREQTGVLLEPNGGARPFTSLTSEEYEVERCQSRPGGRVGKQQARRCVGSVAEHEGLLADEHRYAAQVTDRLSMVLMVPRRWLRLLDQSLRLIAMPPNRSAPGSSCARRSRFRPRAYAPSAERRLASLVAQAEV